jgi:hypothetical protein
MQRICQNPPKDAANPSHDDPVAAAGQGKVSSFPLHWAAQLVRALYPTFMLRCFWKKIVQESEREISVK